MTEEKDNKKTSDDQDAQPEVSIDLGFGGLFKGLSNFVDLLSTMVDENQEETSRTGTFKVKGLGDQARGVYGINIRTGLGGTPKVGTFGNIRDSEEGPVVAEVREPMVDVFDEKDEIVIVAELPGVSEAEIETNLEEDILRLETTGERKYAKEILLESPVDAGTMRRSYNNGILEIRIGTTA